MQNHVLRRLRVVIALAVAWIAMPQASASSIERFQAFVRSTQSARADFEQKVYDRNKKLVQESKGNFAFVRPGRFRWAFAKPYTQLIVGDGEKVWVYDQDLNQVTVRKLSHALGATPAALISGSADVEQSFVFSDAGESEGLQWLDAKPKEKEAGFERIRMGFGPSGIDAMELVDQFGQVTMLRFTNLQRNPKLDPGTFRFTPPKGADLLGQ
jgi:outer membrane lipoprotein carrier protein